MLQRFADPVAIAAEIERVRSLSGDTLRRRWRVVFGRSPPQHLTADLLLTTAKHFVLDKLKLAAAMGACSTPALELGGARKGEVFSVGPRGNPTRNPTAPPRK